MDLGLSQDAAIAEIASELNIGIDALTTAIEGISTQVGEIESNILAKMKEYQDQNMSADDALAKAIEDVAGELGKTKEDILTQLGTTEANLGAKFDAGFDALSGQIEDTRKAILEEVAKNEAAGMKRDDALSAAIDTVAGNLETTKADILAQLGTTEENLANDIADVKSDVQIVADYVGKPASEVTDADIDFVADLIAQQEVLADPTSFVPTDAQLQYDVNNDGVIDINDQNMLTESLGGQEVDLYGNKFNATGLYAYNDAIAAQQKREADARFEAEQQLEADRQLEMQTQANYNKEQGKVQDLFKDIASSSDLAGGTATTTPGPLTNIDYLYDIGGDSIFANSRQEELFATPYGESNSRRPVQDRRLAAAQGGLLKRNNELLRLLGED